MDKTIEKERVFDYNIRIFLRNMEDIGMKKPLALMLGTLLFVCFIAAGAHAEDACGAPLGEVSAGEVEGVDFGAADDPMEAPDAGTGDDEDLPPEKQPIGEDHIHSWKIVSGPAKSGVSYRKLDAAQHTASQTTVTVYECDVCRAQYMDQSKQSRQEPHSIQNGKCALCGEAVSEPSEPAGGVHEHIWRPMTGDELMALGYGSGATDPEYEYEGAEGHYAFWGEYVGTVCEICQEQSVTTRYTEELRAHRYSVKGDVRICTLCGYSEPVPVETPAPEAPAHSSGDRPSGGNSDMPKTGDSGPAKEVWLILSGCCLAGFWIARRNRASVK